MFALSTADVALSWRLFIHDVPSVLQLKTSIDVVAAYVSRKTYFFKMNSMIADAVLIYRCYMTWNRNMYILLVATVALIAQTVIGFLSINVPVWNPETISPAYLWMTLAFNVSMTLLTAGRIGWLTFNVRGVLEKQSIKKYQVLITMIVQSGTIYSFSLILLAIESQTFLTGQLPELYLSSYTLASRVITIMPALMVVQVELQRREDALSEAESSKDILQPMRFNDLSVQQSSVIHQSRNSDLGLAYIAEPGVNLEA